MKAFTKAFLFTACSGGLLLASCTKPEIEQAFGPAMAPPESKKIIVSYCGSCHQHKDFNADAHVPAAQTKYKDPAFSSASDCRVCHTYSMNFVGDVTRGTHRPSK